MKSLKIALAALAGTAMALTMTSALLAQDSAPTVARPWMNTSLSADKRADLLLAQMTVEEKMALLHGPMAMPFGPKFPMPAGAIGSAGFIAGNARLGIPALQESDASLGVTNPLGVRPGDMSTPLPSSLLLAATWNPQIAFDGGAMVGDEARAKGINVMLAGGANIARDPRAGRNFEYLGEDPLLTGTIAGAAIRGIQSQHVVSTVKHFALNAQEHLRMTLDSRIGEAAFRESDLLAFQIAIERGQPGSVMCAYNQVNGSYACQNDALLNGVLKRDWGYPGWVMSDWGAVHGVEAANAGLDQQSGEQLDKQIWFGKPLADAVAAGQVSPARITDMARRVLRSMFAVGLFDTPAGKAQIDWEAHAAVARRQADEGIVLLSNPRGLLPLAGAAKRIAVIGGNADAGVASGGGSSQVTMPHTTGFMPVRSVPQGGEGMMAMFLNTVFHPSSPLAAIRARAKGAEVRFDTGAYPAQAAALAKESDLAVVFVYQPSAEGDDVPDLSLPSGQDALVQAVLEANPNTIVVLETGNPVRMPWADKAGAVVQAWYAGARGGDAIAALLFGEVNPSGRLPISWPVDEQELPRPEIPGWRLPVTASVAVDYAIEGADVGYRWYAREKRTPRYAFGYGLSYTRFGYANLRVQGGRTLTASFDVTNQGARAGKDVPQLYLLATPGKPAQRLIGFEKIELQPGETRHVTLTADRRLLASFDPAAHGWRIDGGSYQIGLGANAAAIALRQSVRLSAARFKP